MSDSFPPILLTGTQAGQLIDALTALQSAINTHAASHGDSSRYEWGDGSTATADIDALNGLVAALTMLSSAETNNYPLASEVAQAAHLKPTQVDPTFTTDDLNDDIDLRISEQTAVVYSRLSNASAPILFPTPTAVLQQVYPGELATDYDARSLRQVQNARLAIKFLALGSLLRSAGQGQDYYTNLATAYDSRAENVLTIMETELAFIMDSGKAPVMLKLGPGLYNQPGIPTPQSDIPSEFFSDDDTEFIIYP